jgi:hypothetical protein
MGRHHLQPDMFPENSRTCLMEKVMPIPKELLADLELNPEFRRPFVEWVKPWPLHKRADILVVVDTNISTNPANDFGIARVIELIRGAAVGCMRFNVDIALRNGDASVVTVAPGPFDPKYRGFRFDMQVAGVSVIDKYEQVWCFGFKPNNSGSLSDADINLASAFPASDAELAKLSQWMNERKGGLFGTGDHHFLGASMCKRIPRLGTMRRWTNADGVPPQFSADRIDTLRPPSAAHEPGAPGGPLDLANDLHQGDLVVQSIQWVTWQRALWPFTRRRRPHPVLCHPRLGPINVMPDHAHEGLCVETADIPAGNTFNFDGAGARPEYPPSLSGGAQPLPMIIAYGSTLGDPPYNFFKGAQPVRAKFPMISVYDGHAAGVGRVATDSTWHHWMDVNLNVMRSANTVEWQKISRYFINLAVWLNPPGFTTNCFWLEVVASHFQAVGFQEYQDRASVTELGGSLRQHLAVRYGPCWVSDRIWDLVLERQLWPWDISQDIRPKFDRAGFDPELIEDLVLGHLVLATVKAAAAVKDAANDGKTRIQVALPGPEQLFAPALKAAVKELAEGFTEHFEMGLKLAQVLAR